MAEVTIRAMLNRVIQAKQGIPIETDDIINRFSEQILDLNRMNQLFMEGKDKDGNIIGRYSITTEVAYGGAEKGKFAGDPYNFEDTGDFFEGFKLNFNNGKLELFSTDSKTPELVQKYGNKIFGLNHDHQMELNYEIIKPELVIFLKQTIYGG